MPAKPKNTRTGSGQFTTTFVQYRLNAQEKKEYLSWKEKLGDALETEVVDMLQHKYKMSVSWDSMNDCWIASATCKDEGHPNYDKCLTSRSDNWFDAITMNVYKTWQLCSDQNWDELQADSELG